MFRLLIYAVFNSSCLSFDLTFVNVFVCVGKKKTLLFDLKMSSLVAIQIFHHESSNQLFSDVFSL